MSEPFRLTDDQLWAMQEAARKREKERQKQALLAATEAAGRKSSEAEKAKSRDKFVSGTNAKLANSELDNYNFARSIKEAAVKKKRKFADDLKANLVAESIAYPYSEVAKANNFTQEQTELGRKLIDNFVVETGAENILKNMREGTIVTSLYADIINETTQEVLEACGKKSKDTKTEEYDICYTFDKEYADKFVNSLANATPSALSNIISNRVSSAVQDFVNKQQDDQNTIKDILNSAKDKIASAKEKKFSEQALKEYTEQTEIAARHKISLIYRENTNLYGRMVKNFSKEMVNEQAMKDAGYVKEDGKLNIAKVMNDTQVMYTVLETINTAGFYDIDKAYVASIVA
jgi:hypothetical protein